MAQLQGLAAALPPLLPSLQRLRLLYTAPPALQLAPFSQLASLQSLDLSGGPRRPPGEPARSPAPAACNKASEQRSAAQRSRLTLPPLLPQSATTAATTCSPWPRGCQA